MRNNDVDRYRRRFYSLYHSAATCIRAYTRRRRPRPACQTDSGLLLFDFAPRAQSEPPSEAIKRKKPGLLHKHHELFFPPSAHYVKPSAELCSFEPIFELLAHLSGLDFCLCQRRDRERSPLSTPPAVQCRRKKRPQSPPADRVDLETELQCVHSSAG